MNDDDLIAAATAVAGSFKASEDCSAGGVAAALLTASGHVFTGICIEAECGLGFCAEHSAVAEMLKARETEIVAAVAVTDDGRIFAPCGRCRELLWQVNPRNLSARIILGSGRSTTLQDLLPHRWS